MQLFSQISGEQSPLDFVGDEFASMLGTGRHFVSKQRGSDVRYVSTLIVDEHFECEVRDQVRVRTTFRF